MSDVDSLDATLRSAPQDAGDPALARSWPVGPRYRVHTALDDHTVVADDRRLGRAVAIKRLPDPELTDAGVARFVREATLQARLEHPAIAPIHEVGRDTDGRPFFAMKRLTGRTLAALLAADDATPQHLLRAFVDVCVAIDFAHARGVVHRALAPARVVLGDYGEVYVIDWSAGDDADPAGTAADVHALGAVLFEILAREPLGTGTPSPLQRCPTRQIPPELDGVCLAALAPNPADRPGARALADRVQRYLDGARDVEARRASAVQTLELGRAALGAGDRATAIQLLHRAQWLDPASTDALALVHSLVDDPSLSPPAAAELAAIERRGVRHRSGRALLPLSGFLVALPVFLVLEVRNYVGLVALYAAVFATSVVSYVNWRVRPVPLAILLVANLTLVVAFSRFAGPFVITPLLIAALVLPISAIPWMNDRPWAIHGYTLALALAPIGLELAGVLAPTWGVSADALLSFGSIFAFDDPHAGEVAVISNVFAMFVVAVYARRVANDRRAEQRRLHVQEWHLRQLLPRTTRRASTV